MSDETRLSAPNSDKKPDVLACDPGDDISEGAKQLLEGFMHEFRDRAKEGEQFKISDKYFILAVYREFDRFRKDRKDLPKIGSVIDLQDLSDKQLREMWKRTQVHEGKKAKNA